MNDSSIKILLVLAAVLCCPQTPAHAEIGWGDSRVIEVNTLDDSLANSSHFDQFVFLYCGAPPDLDGDCNVDFADFSILAPAWLTNDPQADVEPDHQINFLDLMTIANNWLKSWPNTN